MYLKFFKENDTFRFKKILKFLYNNETLIKLYLKLNYLKLYTSLCDDNFFYITIFHFVYKSLEN